MGKNWTEDAAKSYLSSQRDIAFNGKVVNVEEYNGLKALSALDYLKNFCGYNIIYNKMVTTGAP